MTAKTFPPAFTNAMRQYERIAALHGEDSEQARDAFLQVMLKAPSWLQDEANAIAEKIGLLPEQRRHINRQQQFQQTAMRVQP